MADTIDTAFVQSFQNLIVSLFAEDADGMRETVRSKPVTGKYDHWDRLGGTQLVQKTTRLASTPHTEMTHSRRRAALTDWHGAEYLDKDDEVRLLIDPRNEYTQNLVRAWRQRLARIITDALDAAATVVAADDTTTTAALPASQVIANGGTGLTVAKLRQANRILDNAGVPATPRTLLTSAFGIEDLLQDSQVTSADYNTLGALRQGRIPQGEYMGFQIKMISDAIPDDTAVLTGGSADPIILPKSGNIRTCFAYHKSAVGLSIGKEIETRISERNDLSHAWQVYVLGTLGAVRILDAGVVTIDIDESV